MCHCASRTLAQLFEALLLRPVAVTTGVWCSKRGRELSGRTSSAAKKGRTQTTSQKHNTPVACASARERSFPAGLQSQQFSSAVRSREPKPCRSSSQRHRRMRQRRKWDTIAGRRTVLLVQARTLHESTSSCHSARSPQCARWQ